MAAPTTPSPSASPAASSSPAHLLAVPLQATPADLVRPPAPVLRAAVGGRGLDVATLLQDAVGCRPRGSPEVELDLCAPRLRLHGRAAEAWLASWLQAWFRWVDDIACGTVQARLSVAGDPARARLRLQFTPLDQPRGHYVLADGEAGVPLATAPCWRSFLPLGAALHEIGPARTGHPDEPARIGPRLHRVHIDLGPCSGDA